MKDSNLLKILMTSLMLIMTIACQDTIPSRPTINNSQTVDEEPEPEEPVQVVRPTNSIRWKDDYCICKDSKPVSYGNCTSFCSGRNTSGEEILYANFQIGSDVQLGGFGSVYGWCTKPIPNADGEELNPKCVIRATASSGDSTNIDINIGVNSNSATAVVSGFLEDNKTYVLTLVEITSEAKSNSIQTVKFSEDIQTPILGPLKRNPITQFMCVGRVNMEDSGNNDVYYESAFRLHYYFQPRTPPSPIPAGVNNIACHDFMNPLYGIVDSALYPRLDEKPGAFTLWDDTDPRFFDNDGNGVAEVNDMIRQKTIHYGGTIRNGTNFFNHFQWPNGPELEIDGSNSVSTVLPLGYYMSPWIDQYTYKSYCLNSNHYRQNNPLFKALGDVIQVDTEGLYVGVKTGDSYTDRDGNAQIAPDDILLIRETDLKRVWFHRESNGTLKAPTDANVANVAVYFHYPLNFDAPYVRSSNQKLFRVKSAKELNSGTVTDGTNQDNGAVGQYPPHDRRIGCVPK